MQKQIEDLILNTLSASTQTRTQAEQLLIQLQQSDFSTFTSTLVDILTCESKDPHIRFTSGVILRNSLYSSFYETFRVIQSKWLAIPEPERLRIKKALLNAFTSSNKNAGQFCATVIACIARIELENNLWPDFFSFFLNQIQQENNEIYLKNVITTIATTIVYLKEKTPQECVFPILIHFLKHTAEQSLLLHNLKALSDVQEYIQDILRKNSDYFLGVLVGLCNFTEEHTVQVLININKYTSFSVDYISDLKKLKLFVVNFMKKEESVALQSIEFFSTLADLETQNQKVYVKDFLNVLLPNLFYSLKKGEDFDDEEWSVHKAASACLQTISSNVNLLGDPGIKSFIIEKLRSNEKNEIEEGIIALGSCLHFGFYADFVKSTDVVHQPNFIYDNETALFLKNIVPIVLDQVKITTDLNVQIDDPIRNSALWCLAKICETNYQCIESIKDLQDIVERAEVVLQEKCKESLNAAWVIHNVCASIVRLTDSDTYENSITFYYLRLIDILVSSSDTVEFNNFQLRHAIFCALQEAVKACTKASILVLDNLWVYFMKKTWECIDYIPKSTPDQFFIIEDLMSSYVYLLQTIYLKKGEKGMGEKKKDLLNVFLTVLSINRETPLFGDIYTCISSFCEIKSFFIISIDKFIPFIMRDLKSTDNFIVKSTITLIGDISTAMSVGFLSHSNIIIPGLITALQRNDIDREIKPSIISVFGDISLVLGRSFEPYAEMCLNLLNQIIMINRAVDEEFVDKLRESVLSLLSCLILSLEDSAKIKKNILIINEIIKKISMEDVNGRNTENCLNIVGDMLAIYGRRAEFSWVDGYLKQCAVNIKYATLVRQVIDKIERFN